MPIYVTSATQRRLKIRICIKQFLFNKAQPFLCMPWRPKCRAILLKIVIFRTLRPKVNYSYIWVWSVVIEFIYYSRLASWHSSTNVAVGSVSFIFIGLWCISMYTAGQFCGTITVEVWCLRNLFRASVWRIIIIEYTVYHEKQYCKQWNDTRKWHSYVVYALQTGIRSSNREI